MALIFNASPGKFSDGSTIKELGYDPIGYGEYTCDSYPEVPTPPEGYGDCGPSYWYNDTYGQFSPGTAYPEGTEFIYGSYIILELDIYIDHELVMHIEGTETYSLPNIPKEGHTLLGYTRNEYREPEDYSVDYQVGDTLQAFSYGNNSVDFYTVYQKNKYYLDPYAIVDGVRYYDTHDYATYEVFINGGYWDGPTNDFCQQFDYGSTYEITNIQPSSGYKFIGVRAGDVSNLPIGESGVTEMPNGNGGLIGVLDKTTWVYLEFEKIANNVKIKTDSGWQQSKTIYRKLEDGWKVVDNPFKVKTSDGWK